MDNADTLLSQVIQILLEMETPAYLVGGAVRDQMLRAREKPGAGPPGPTYDLDFAVPGDGLHIARRIADALDGAYYPLDPKRGVGRAVLTDDQGQVRIVDVARFQGPDLMADLSGRDFTINAMAMDLTHDPPGPIDPLGGQADLQAGQLRAVSDQALRKDPVRGLRAVRLAAELGFEIESRTQTLIQATAPDLAGISAERVRDELAKILSLPAVAGSLRRLDELNLLVEILPEVTALKGVAQTSPHRWDAYQHTLQTVAALETLLPLDGRPPHPDLPLPGQVVGHLATVVTGGQNRRSLLTLAALLHDLGKRDTASADPDGRAHFIGHERLGATLAAEAMRRLRFAGAALRLVEIIVRHHLRPLQLAWQGTVSRRAIHRFFRDTGDAGVDVALLSLADHRATIGLDAAGDGSPEATQGYPALLEVARSLLDAHFNRQRTVVAPPPLLTGRDLIRQFGLAEGPALGRLLAALQEAQATGQVTSREEAEAWVRERIADRSSGQ